MHNPFRTIRANRQRDAIARQALNDLQATANANRQTTAAADDAYDSEAQSQAQALQEAMARYEIRMKAYY